MSDEVLKLIPEDKDFLPSIESAERARRFLEDCFPDGEQAEIELSETVQFIDSGENLERIKCPICSESTEINPFQENDAGTNWWYALDESLSLSPDLNSLNIIMPCCGKQALLQSVDFMGFAGFSKFELCIWNPYANSNTLNEQVSQVEDLLNCKLKIIWAKY